MQLTIVKPDNLVIVDNHGLEFDLSGFDCPENLHALQWTADAQHIEFTDQPNEPLTELPEWAQGIMAEHQRRLQRQQENQQREEAHGLYIGNGLARQERLRKHQEQLLGDRINTLEQQVDQLTTTGH